MTYGTWSFDATFSSSIHPAQIETYLLILKGKKFSSGPGFKPGSPEKKRKFISFRFSFAIKNNSLREKEGEKLNIFV